MLQDADGAEEPREVVSLDEWVDLLDSLFRSLDAAKKSKERPQQRHSPLKSAAPEGSSRLFATILLQYYAE